MSRRKLRDFGDGRVICGALRYKLGHTICTRVSGHQGDHICQWANGWNVDWPAT